MSSIVHTATTISILARIRIQKVHLAEDRTMRVAATVREALEVLWALMPRTLYRVRRRLQSRSRGSRARDYNSLSLRPEIGFDSSTIAETSCALRIAF